LLAVSPGLLPAVIEEDGDDVRLPALGHSEESEDILQILISILDVGCNMEEDSEFTEAEVSGPSQFLVDLVEVQLFPHLDLVVSVGRDVVYASSPLVAVVPVEGFLLSPTSRDAR
jgi:hypothetical protein